MSECRGAVAPGLSGATTKGSRRAVADGLSGATEVRGSEAREEAAYSPEATGRRVRGSAAREAEPRLKGARFGRYGGSSPREIQPNGQWRLGPKESPCPFGI